jgi:hypothetical protein
MFVPSYQMHNVLNVYSKKLRRKMMSGKNQNMSEKSPSDRASITSEGKRRATIEKVSREIFDKITRFDSMADSSQLSDDPIRGKQNNENGSEEEDKSRFVFNVIDTINKKKTNTISVEDPNFFIQRLDQWARDSRTEEQYDKTEKHHKEVDHPGEMENSAI